MSWFSRKPKNTITVEFIENGAAKPFAVSDMSLDQLPDSFESETTFEIKDEQWIVVQAAPNNKEEFSKTGKLNIVLDKIEMVDPRELLFSLPTINDQIAETEQVSIDNLFTIHEDDWRQAEFISKKYHSEIKKELESVIEINEKHRVGNGFDKIHIRQLITQPLDDKNINLEELKGLLNIARNSNGFGLAKIGKVKNSFAFQSSDGATFYGQTKNGLISVLCVHNGEDSVQTIKHIAEKYDIVFVDWCKAETTE